MTIRFFIGVLLALMLSLCACGADFADREFSEGGYVDPNGKTVSLRAEWMD